MDEKTRTRATYERIIWKAYELEKDHVAEEWDKGLQQVRSLTPLFGFFPPRWMLEYGATCAFLYTRSGKAQLAEQARDALFFYRDWLKYLPPNAASLRPEYEAGIGPMEPVFMPLIFVPAFQSIRDALTGSEIEMFTGILADSLRPIWRFPEWGGHNRAMLRAAGLSSAAQAFPDHPEARQWRLLADELAEESWGRWSIEDAMLYQPHWLRSLIRYAETSGREAQLNDLIQPRMHLKAMTQLISPLGILPDFGDSHWIMHSHWEWMACLEWGARAYRDPVMKWAANRIFLGNEPETPTGYLATVAMLAWNWCDENLSPNEPINQGDALDDLVLKKMVWRTGWGPEATYACLNYRDEGDYGRAARDYLRATLAVSAEKMHHGHADEGGFSMLVHAGTLLLHESGYREQPPDGIYRSGIYHNRLMWRSGSKPDGQGLLEFLRADGRYLPVRTERIYQTRLMDVEFSRIRTTDENEGLVWDRSMIFLPGLPCWIVIDGVLATRAQFRTISALWWTTDLLAQGWNWFETHQRGVMDWSNSKNAALSILLPDVPQQSGKVAATPFRRHFQDELALTRTWAGEHRLGGYVNFVTILWPHGFSDLDAARQTAVEVVESQPHGRGIGVRLRWQGTEWLFGTLNDLNVGIGQEDIRPTYSAGRGMTTYGPISSDAAFVSMRKGAQGNSAGFINGTVYALDDQIRYETPQHGMFQEDRTALPGSAARFRWESG